MTKKKLEKLMKKKEKQITNPGSIRAERWRPCSSVSILRENSVTTNFWRHQTLLFFKKKKKKKKKNDQNQGKLKKHKEKKNLPTASNDQTSPSPSPFLFLIPVLDNKTSEFEMVWLLWSCWSVVIHYQKEKRKRKKECVSVGFQNLCWSHDLPDTSSTEGLCLFFAEEGAANFNSRGEFGLWTRKIFYVNKIKEKQQINSQTKKNKKKNLTCERSS